MAKYCNFCHKNFEGIISLNFLVKKHGKDLLLELKCTFEGFWQSEYIHSEKNVLF